jgi:hypothetical protein
MPNKWAPALLAVQATEIHLWKYTRFDSLVKKLYLKIRRAKLDASSDGK